MAGLYIHVPFRESDRAYDDSVVVASHRPDYDAFARALVSELDQYEAAHSTAGISSIYVGGGRPSLVPISDLETVAEKVRVFDVEGTAEVTIEVNPRDASDAYMQKVAAMGFNRVSLAALSFFDEELSTIGAPHQAHHIEPAVARSRAAGIDNISVDIAFGWAESTLEMWQETLREAVALEVPHITLIEWPTVPRDNETEMTRAKQYRHALLDLEEEGFEAYEISHLSRPGHRSQHNENYWAHGSFLGTGPAAHSFWWPGRNEKPHRWVNVSDLAVYMQRLNDGRAPVATREEVDPEALAGEYLTLRLRTRDGLNLARYRDVYGVDLRAQRASLLDRLQENALISPITDNTLRLTNAGWLVYNSIVQRLLSN